MLAFLFYNKSMISNSVKGVSFIISLLFLIYVQTRLTSSQMVAYCVLALCIVATFFYAFICKSKHISCSIALYLSIECIQIGAYNVHDQTFFRNCTLAYTTYRIVSTGFLYVLFVSFFGQHAFENLSNVESLLKIQQDLVRNMSHEMRTPLGNVRMSIENVRTCQFYNSLQIIIV